MNVQHVKLEHILIKILSAVIKLYVEEILFFQVKKMTVYVKIGKNLSIMAVFVFNVLHRIDGILLYVLV
jgi:hypothetical protein